MHELMETLYSLDKLRRSLTHAEWKQFCLTEPIGYPLHRLLLQDPATRMVFEHSTSELADPELSGLLFDPSSGRDDSHSSVNDFLSYSDPLLAINHRSKYMADYVDKIAVRVGYPPDILMVGDAKRLEVDLSQTIVQARYNKYIVVNDPDQLITFNQRFDLAIVPSMLNYLDQDRALELVFWMFERLKHGGSMLLALFRKESPNSLYRTYMEAFLHWFMEYRSDEEIIALFDLIPNAQIEDFQISSDPYCNISYASVRKNKN